MRNITLGERLPSPSQFFKRQLLAALLRRKDQIKVVVGRDAPPNRPRVRSRIGHAKIIGDFLDRGPNVFDVLHGQILRGMRSFGQYANCSVRFAGCEFMIRGGTTR